MALSYPTYRLLAVVAAITKVSWRLIARHEFPSAGAISPWVYRIHVIRIHGLHDIWSVADASLHYSFF